MSVDLNVSIFGGRLCRDPEELGDTGCKFRLASNRTFTSGGEKKEDTAYMTVIAWAGLAKTVLNNCVKGDPVIVTGRIETRNFKGDDGQEKVYTSIVANDIRLIRLSGTQEKQAKKEAQKALAGLSPSAKRSLLDLVERD